LASAAISSTSSACVGSASSSRAAIVLSPSGTRAPGPTRISVCGVSRWRRPISRSTLLTIGSSIWRATSRSSQTPATLIDRMCASTSCGARPGPSTEVGMPTRASPLARL
jgi:hypothetical protein